MKGRRRYEDAIGREALIKAIYEAKKHIVKNSPSHKNPIPNDNPASYKNPVSNNNSKNTQNENSIKQNCEYEMNSKTEPKVTFQETDSKTSQAKPKPKSGHEAKYFNKLEIDSSDSDFSEEDSPKQSRKAAPSQRNADLIMVGMIGHPNVGKSSLINGLVGKKVVSTSRSPGHTKHFQTIYLTKEIVLVDCPGLVFPAVNRPKSLQILCGLFPLAQVREPFSAISFLCERIPLEKIYGLKKSDCDDSSGSWSSWDITEAFAEKRGYYLSRGGNPDMHRAGREILNDAVDGRLPIYWNAPEIDISNSELEKEMEKANELFENMPLPLVKTRSQSIEIPQEKREKIISLSPKKIDIHELDSIGNPLISKKSKKKKKVK